MIQRLQTCQARLYGARNEFNNLPHLERDKWEQYRLQHLRQWSSIKDTLMRELRKNNSICYKRLASKINYWCGDTTIRKWVQSRDGYHLYIERVVPLLSEAQKQKHLECAKRIRTNWGLGAGKYHKSHISKVMAVCTLGFAFVDNIENGGDALKIDLLIVMLLVQSVGQLTIRNLRC